MDLKEDLVCKMLVTDENPRFFSDYDNKLYPFCSAECKRKFDDHPDYFIHQHAKEELGMA